MKHLRSVIVLFVLLCHGTGWAAVTYDAAGYGENTSSTTSIPDFTVSLTGTNGAVAVVVTQSINSATGISVTIGGVSASLVSGTDSGTSQAYRSFIYGLATGSTSGSQTVSVSWTGSAWAAASAVAATGVDQTTPFNNGTFNQAGTGPTASVVVTSATDDLTFAGVSCESGGTPTAPTQTSVHADNAGFQVGIGSSRAAGAATVTHEWSTGSGWTFSGVNFRAASATPIEQEGFRWGVDDGNESAHTWEAAQDTNITINGNQGRLLRVLLNATGDPPTAAHTLRVQKNGSGGYVSLQVGASYKATPVIEPGDATNSGNDTASTSWAISHPTAAPGDLLIFVIGWDDSTNTTSVSAPSGPNGETITSIAGPVASNSDEVRLQAWYTVATGSWSASTVTFTPNASEQWTGTVIKVLAGEFDAATPIGASNTRSSAGTAESNALSPSLTAGGSDGSGKLVWATVVDADPLVTLQAGNTQISNVDRGATSMGVAVRDAAVTNSESVAGGDTWSLASDSWASLTFVVRAPTINNEVYVNTSANITAGGEATTARLTAPAGKSTSDFVTGRRWDDENGADSIDITTDDYTEVEWLVFLASSVSPGDYYEFRVYKGSDAAETYTVTPRWTVPSSGAVQSLRLLLGVGQ